MPVRLSVWRALMVSIGSSRCSVKCGYPRKLKANCLAGGGATEDQAVIRAAVDRRVLNIWSDSIEPVIAVDLDQGESACIHLALSHPGSLLPMDEQAGRAVARENRIAVAGTAAVIGQARKRHLIPSARDVFERLLQSDFRIAPEVIRTVLRQVGED